jgi:HD-like signal output (HDOD) protein
MDMSQQDLPQIEDEAEAIVRKLGLPPCPDVLADIAREVRREMPDVQKIAGLVTRDVASSATVLKTVNSAFYGLAAKARSVQQAIAYLGLDRTAFLLAALLLRNAFPQSNRTAMVRFWETSTQLALTVSFFARVLDLGDRDEAHTFGLFRDAGSAVLIGKFDDYADVVERATGAPPSRITELEKEHFGADHAVIGAVLARDWQLPEEMSEAILWHHADFVLDLSERPIPDESVRFIALGILGDRVLDRYRGTLPNEQTARTMDQALDLLGVRQAQYADLQFEAMTLLDEVQGGPMPTMRMRTITR